MWNKIKETLFVQNGIPSTSTSMFTLSTLSTIIFAWGYFLASMAVVIAGIYGIEVKVPDFVVKVALVLIGGSGLASVGTAANYLGKRVVEARKPMAKLPPPMQVIDRTP